MIKRFDPVWVLVAVVLVLTALGAFFGAYREYQSQQAYNAELDRIQAEHQKYDESIEQKFAEFKESYCEWMFTESEFAAVGDEPFSIYIAPLENCPQIWGELKFSHYLDNLVQQSEGGLVKLVSGTPYSVSFGMDEAVATEVTTRTEYPDGDTYFFTEYILSDDFPIYGLERITVEPCESDRIAQEHEVVIKICGEEK